MKKKTKKSLAPEIRTADALTAMYADLSRLQMLAEENGFKDEAAEIAVKKSEIKKTMESRLSEFHSRWNKDSGRLSGKISRSAAGIHRCIGDIEKNVNTAEKIVKAARYLDDAVKTAAEVMK